MSVIEEPLRLDRLASITGNPMLCIGYQCCDLVPYFLFGDSLFTKVCSDNCVTPTEVSVYAKTVKTVDGKDYDAMVYAGSGTQEGAGLTYEGNTYTYGSSRIDVRQFNLNKWAAHKPVAVNTVIDLTDNDFYTHNYGLKAIDSSGAGTRSGYRYDPPGLSSGAFRITDFIGYNPDAECPIKDLREAFSGDFDVEAQHTFLADDIINRSEGVEITLPEMRLSGNWFLGYFFKRKGDDDSEGFYHTFHIRLEDAMAEAGTQGHGFVIDEYMWNEGDEIVIDAIAVFQEYPATDEETVLYGKLSGTGGMHAFLCPDTGEDNPRGRAIVKAVNCWAQSYKRLSFYAVDVTASISGADYTVDFYMTFRNLVQESMGTRESFWYSFFGSVNGEAMTESTKEHRNTPIQYGESISGRPASSAIVTADTMRDDKGYVTVEGGMHIYKFHADTAEYELVYTVQMSSRNVKVTNDFDNY